MVDVLMKELTQFSENIKISIRFADKDFKIKDGYIGTLYEDDKVFQIRWGENQQQIRFTFTKKDAYIYVAFDHRVDADEILGFDLLKIGDKYALYCAVDDGFIKPEQMMCFIEISSEEEALSWISNVMNHLAKFRKDDPKKLESRKKERIRTASLNIISQYITSLYERRSKIEKKDESEQSDNDKRDLIWSSNHIDIMQAFRKKIESHELEGEAILKKQKELFAQFGNEYKEELESKSPEERTLMENESLKLMSMLEKINPIGKD